MLELMIDMAMNAIYTCLHTNVRREYLTSIATLIDKPFKSCTMVGTLLAAPDSRAQIEFRRVLRFDEDKTWQILSSRFVNWICIS